MKKIVALTLIGALALGLVFTGVVNAESPKDKAKDMARHIPMMGTVERISANTVILKAVGMDFMTIEVTTNDETTFYDVTGEMEKGEKPPEIKWNEIKKGDKVVAKGQIMRDGEGEDATTYYLAQSVSKVNHFPKPDPRDKDEGPPEIHAVLQSVNGNTLTVTDPSGEKEFEVTVSDETKYGEVTMDEDGKPSREEISLADLQSGDKLVIIGKPEKDDEGNVTMNAIAIMVVEEFPPKRDPRDRDDRRHEFMGTFDSWDGDYMVCSPAFGSGEDVKFKVTDETKYFAFVETTEGEKPEKVEKSKDDLAPGQAVSVVIFPKRNDDGEMERVVRYVILLDALKGRIHGKIESISPTSITLEIGRDGEDTATFSITSDTRIEKHVRGEEPVELTVADLEEGDFVTVGFEDDTAVAIIKMEKPERPEERP